MRSAATARAAAPERHKAGAHQHELEWARLREALFDGVDDDSGTLVTLNILALSRCLDATPWLHLPLVRAASVEGTAVDLLVPRHIVVDEEGAPIPSTLRMHMLIQANWTSFLWRCGAVGGGAYVCQAVMGKAAQLAAVSHPRIAGARYFVSHVGAVTIAGYAWCPRHGLHKVRENCCAGGGARARQLLLPLLA